MSGLPVRCSGKNGVAVVEVLNGNTTMMFLGASCVSSATPGTSGLSSVTLSLNQGEEAVVGLIVTTRYAKQTDIVRAGLVGLSRVGDELIFDADKAFVSSTDHLGQVVPGREVIQVKTRGQIFGVSCSSSYAGVYNKQLAEDGVRVVKDANLLCRYLVNQATFPELEAVASEDPRRADEIRINELLSESEYWNVRCVSAERKLEISQQSAGAYRVEYLRLMEEGSDLRAQLNRTLGARWRKFRDRVRDELMAPKAG